MCDNMLIISIHIIKEVFPWLSVNPDQFSLIILLY